MADRFNTLIRTILIGLATFLVGYSTGFDHCSSYEYCNCSDNIQILSAECTNIRGAYTTSRHWNLEVTQPLSLEDIDRLKKEFSPYCSLNISIREGED